jgi:membrane dipeptidase
MTPAKKMNRSCVLAILLALITGNACAASASSLQHAQEILDETPIADGHNDLPGVIRLKANGNVAQWDISGRAASDTDIPRLREGKVGTQFWSVYVPTGISPAEALRQQLEQIDIARQVIERYPNDLGYADSVSSILAEQRRGRIASLLGIEGGHVIDNSLGALRAYYLLGVRYMTLTHFHSNDWADSATGEALHQGLSPFGVQVVQEMNRMGMMVDLAHVSEATMGDALDAVQAPVIFSHAAARGVVDHTRNVPDAILRRMPENGGVVMVAFIPQFVSEPVRLWADELWQLQVAKAYSEAELQKLTEDYIAKNGPSPRATISDVADHIDHIAKVAGFDHVGIGADYYGADNEYELVQGLEDVSSYPKLFAELVERGWSDDNLRKLASGNLMRVFADVEAVAARLGSTTQPSNATIQ